MVNLKIENDLYDRLKVKREETAVPIAALVRKAIEAYLSDKNTGEENTGEENPGVNNSDRQEYVSWRVDSVSVNDHAYFRLLVDREVGFDGISENIRRKLFDNGFVRDHGNSYIAHAYDNSDKSLIDAAFSFGCPPTDVDRDVFKLD